MHPIAKAFDRYWRRLKGDREVPRFLDFNINDVPGEALPYMSLVQVENHPRRFRYRLAGTSVVAAYGRDITGLYLDELDTGGKYEAYVHNFNEAADDRVVNRTADEYQLENGRLYRFEGHLYPFEGVRGDISRIIILAIDDWQANH
jgi:hypothetical protein